MKFLLLASLDIRLMWGDVEVGVQGQAEAETDQEHHRLRLRQELVKRCQKNPRYSLRAFSKTLGLEPSFVSKLLKGQRRFTDTTLRKINLVVGDSLSGQRPNFASIQPESAIILSEWYYFAILELALIKNYSLEEKSVARSLGLNRLEAREALESLLRAGFLTQTKKGFRLQTGNNSTLSLGTTSASLRALQHTILQQAQSALDEVNPEARDQTSMTMAIDARLLPEAKARIKKFRRELCAFLQEGRDCDQVYQLSISLFPLTQHKA